MQGATVIPPGGGEVIGDAPDRRVELLCDHDAVHATWSRFGPGRRGAELHVHRRHTDIFYVLEGELTLALGPRGDEVAVPAGTLARLPPLVAHGFRNAGRAPLAYLNLHTPGSGFAAYLRAARDGRPAAYDQEPPPAGGGRPGADAVVAGGGVGAVVAGGVRARTLAAVPEVRVEALELEPGAALPAARAEAEVDAWFVLRGELAAAGDHEAGRAPAGSWAHAHGAEPRPGWAAGGEGASVLRIGAPDARR